MNERGRRQRSVIVAREPLPVRDVAQLVVGGDDDLVERLAAAVSEVRQETSTRRSTKPIRSTSCREPMRRVGFSGIPSLSQVDGRRRLRRCLSTCALVQPVATVFSGSACMIYCIQ